MKTLILTEKPSVARDFAKALNVRANKDGYLESEEYIITWAIGHLVELFEPEDYRPELKHWKLESLPIIPDQFLYKPIANTEKQLRIIQNLLKQNQFNQIVIATDPGREGEVIARTILISSDFDKKKLISRFWTSQALTPEVIQDGLKSLKPASDYDRLWKAGQSRQIADWLVGMNASRAATVRMKDLFSIGRVQTAVLSLLVVRRRERENFKPEPYWILKALFSNDKGSWWGTWFKEDSTRFDKEDDAQKVLLKITDQTGVVASVKKQKKKQPPPSLYSLTDLQRDANTKFGFSASKTLEITQKLYENKFVSYPRTDAKVLGSKNVDMIKSLMKKFSKEYSNTFAGVEEKLIVGSNKRVFNDAKLTDHHALIPLAPIDPKASADEKKIYDLILKRFAAAFHPDCEYEQTEILTEVLKENFRTTGKRILKPGWRVVYGMETMEQSSEDEEDQDNLPPLAKGNPAKVSDTKLAQKMTSPPPEYSEALLLKDMTNPAKYVSSDDLKKIYKGEVGLGTQSTRAQIIETLLSRKYAERKAKHLIATDKGCFLIESLRQFDISQKLTSPEETARWEQQLHSIAQGQGVEEEFLSSIKTFVAQMIEEFKHSKVRQPQQDLGICPACGGKIIEGKRGFGCSNWKAENGGCKFVVWKTISGRMITPNILSKLLSQKETDIYDGFITEDHQRFSGTLKLIEENGEWQVRVEPSKKSSAQKADVLGQCPDCGGDIIEKDKGYGCANWKNQDGGCRFIIWKVIAGKTIPDQIVEQLLENGISENIEGFRSKKGTLFSARLKLEKTEEGKFKVVFVFDKNPNGSNINE